MNKQALAEWVHEKLGGTKVQAEEIVDGLFDSIVNTLGPTSDAIAFLIWCLFIEISLSEDLSEADIFQFCLPARRC